MKVKVRKRNQDGQVRLETRGELKDVLINEDFLTPNKESVSVCFRGKNSSGIIEFSPDEIDEIYDAVKGRVHLIKGMKKFIEEKGKSLI